MKKQKLSLDALTVSSFVTATEQNDLIGGAQTNYKECGTGYETINSCETDYKECGTGYETINSCNTDYAVCGTGPV